MRDLLTSRDVAARLGWESIRTVHSETWRSRAKIGLGRTLLPIDFPLPHTTVGRTPLWTPEAIELYEQARKDAAEQSAWGGRPLDSRTRLIRVEDVTRHDVVISGTTRSVVLDRRHEGEFCELLVGSRRRDPGKWQKYRRGEHLLIYRAENL